MSTLETPPTEPQTPQSERPRRYEEMEHHELIHMLDEVDDERSRARFREAVYISIICWLIIGWFIVYGPRILFHQGKIVNFADVLKQREQLTYIAPPSALHRPPVLKQQPDAKTLQKLREQAPQTPAAPAPQPQEAPKVQQAAPQPQQPPPPQMATTQPIPAAPTPQVRPSPTPAQNQPPVADAPRPQFQTQQKTGFGDLIARSAQQASHGAGADQAPSGPRGSGLRAGAEILSDTQGVDFRAYMARLHADIQRNWDPLIPLSVQPPISKQGVTGIRFKILPGGVIDSLILETKSGDVALDKAAYGAIIAEGQFPPLPKEFHGPFLELRCGFFYNMPVQ